MSTGELPDEDDEELDEYGQPIEYRPMRELSDAQHIQGGKMRWYVRRAKAVREEIEAAHKARNRPPPSIDNLKDRIVDSIIGSKKWRKFVEDETVFDPDEMREDYNAHGEEFVKEIVDDLFQMKRSREEIMGTTYLT